MSVECSKHFVIIRGQTVEVEADTIQDLKACALRTSDSRGPLHWWELYDAARRPVEVNSDQKSQACERVFLRDAEFAVCGRYGNDHTGKVLPFAEFLEKHAESLNRTVDNLYALPGKTKWKSEHRFELGHWFSIANESYNN